MNIIINIKYFYYFHKLICDVCFFILYKKFTSCNNYYLISVINSDIKNNGFIIIKLVQWLLCRYNNLLKNTNKYSSLYNFLQFFQDVYENCNIHSLKYTEKIFLEDFESDIHDLIDIDNDYHIPSASIAQVYRGKLKTTGETVAIKVRHPELENQIVFPYLYYSLYCYLTFKFQCLNKYILPFDLSSFFKNFTQQIDMIYEANNLEYFYMEYKDNPLICVPKPIYWTKNILIMEYIQGEDIEKLDISKYQQYKIILLLNIFVRNNLINLHKVHADLHSSNWKVLNCSNGYKLIIYDFGFCIDTFNISKNILHNIFKSLETNDHMFFAKNIYYFLKTPCNEDDFLKDAELFINSNKTNMTIVNLMEFFINKKYKFKSDILDLTLSSFLVNNYFKRYTTKVDTEKDFENKELNITKKLETTNQHLITLSGICDVNNCFHVLNNHLKEFIKENIDTLIIIKHKKQKDPILIDDNHNNNDNAYIDL